MKSSILVIGLGRFGTAAARELMALDHEVLAVDIDESKVNDIARDVTHAVALDASDEAALRSIGAGDFDQALVAISEISEASIFATMALKNLGVGSVVAKASSALHGAILERVGADRVVYPEREMGVRTSHSLRIAGVIDYLDVAPNFGLVKARPPASYVGRSLGDLALADRLSLIVVAVRRGDDVTVDPPDDLVVAADDELIILGQDGALERLGG